jgi:hypothetical protein
MLHQRQRKLDFAVWNIWNDTPIPDISKMMPEALREYSELSRFHRYTNLA